MQSRRISRVSRGSLGASEGPVVSPLSLSPRSAAASRRASRRNSGVVRWSIGTDAADLDLSKTSLDDQPASPRHFMNLPALGEGEALTGEETPQTPQRRPGIGSWEFPLTRQEMTIRVAMDVPERAANQANEDVLEQLRRLVEERDALQFENELLHAEKADYVEQAVRGPLSRLLEESPMAKFLDSPRTPKPTPADKHRGTGLCFDSPLDSFKHDRMQDHSQERRLQHELEELRVQHKQELEQLNRQFAERDSARVTAQLESERAAHAEELQMEVQHRLQLAEKTDLEKEKHAAELHRVEEGIGQQLQDELKGRAADLQTYEDQRAQWLLERHEIQQRAVAREQEWSEEMEAAQCKHLAEIKRTMAQIAAEQAKTLELQLELQRCQAAMSKSSSTRSHYRCYVLWASMLFLAGVSLGVALSMAHIVDHSAYGTHRHSEVASPSRRGTASLGCHDSDFTGGDCVHEARFEIERADVLLHVTDIDIGTAHAHLLQHWTTTHMQLKNGSDISPFLEEAQLCEPAGAILDATFVDQAMNSNVSPDGLGSANADEEQFDAAAMESQGVRASDEEDVAAAEREGVLLEEPMDVLEAAGVHEREHNVLKALAFATTAAFTTAAGHAR